MLLFCFDCRVWTRAKINYVFIFEFDTRHNLDWRQLSEVLRRNFCVVRSADLCLQIPCILWFLLGLALWLNFQEGAYNPMFKYWPVVLVVISAFVLFSPVPILYHKSREWWAYSNVGHRVLKPRIPLTKFKFRLLLAGIYPVEFRDFFLGDMYCSQTYAMGVSSTSWY